MPLAHLPDLINPLGFGLCLNGKQNKTDNEQMVMARSGWVNFLRALAYAVGTLSMNSPYKQAPSSTIGVIFNIVYIFIGVGVYLIFVIEAGKTIVTAHEEWEKKRAEKKALKKAAKAAKQAAKEAALHNK